MPSIFFWKNWIRSYRALWIALCSIFVFSLLSMWFFQLRGDAGIIHWEKIQEQKTIETTVHSFRMGPFQLNIPGESYVIFEYLQGSDLSHNKTASYIFLFVLMACVAMLLAVITTLEGFWYFTAMGLFIVFVISLRLDVLLVFGQRGIIINVVALTLFIAVSYYFKSIRSATGFLTRLITFVGMFVASWAVIFFFAQTPFPLLHLATTSYTAALILSILFIVMVAHEIPVSFVYIAGQGKSQNLGHFMIIMVIYLVNLIITLLHEMDIVQWDFIYINLYLLISISAILGLWGFKLRETLYDNIFSFAPFGAFFFMAMASLCLATIAQLSGNGNDAALKVVRATIIFSHTAFGIAFLLYLFSNFLAMMAENVQVFKVLYKPNRMPYFTFRLAGVIIALAFVFASQWRDFVYRGLAGFYNYAADLYNMQGNEAFARVFYERSKDNAFQSHRANYALGMMNASRLDFEEADYNFKLANARNPSGFSLVNRGNLYLWRKLYFDAIHIFREGEKQHPSPALQNNLGFAYAKIHNLDSAIFFISKAREDDLTKASAEANFFALAAAEYLPVKTDSTLTLFNSDSPAVRCNAIALATLFNQELNHKMHPLEKKELDLYSATLLNNYIIRNVNAVDTSFIREAYAIADDPVNTAFSEALKASLAHAFYHQGNVAKAQEILGELAYLTQSYRGKYNYMMGLWALEQGNPRLSQTHFAFAVDADYKQAKFYYAIALTEAQQTEKAITAWDSVMAGGDAEEKQIATRVKRILTFRPSEAFSLRDEDKYQYARYRLKANDISYFSQFIDTFDNPNYKAQALLDMAEKQFRNDHPAAATQFFSKAMEQVVTDKDLFEKMRRFELRLLAYNHDAGKLETRLKGFSLEAQPLEKMLYTALTSEARSDMKTAEANYKLLAKWNPYFEDGVLAAARFYRSQDAGSMTPYNILAQAIQVNSNSVRLLKAYIAEAAKQGFDEYAASAAQRLHVILSMQ